MSSSFWMSYKIQKWVVTYRKKHKWQKQDKECYMKMTQFSTTYTRLTPHCTRFYSKQQLPHWSSEASLIFGLKPLQEEGARRQTGFETKRTVIATVKQTGVLYSQQQNNLSTGYNRSEWAKLTFNTLDSAESFPSRSSSIRMRNSCSLCKARKSVLKNREEKGGVFAFGGQIAELRFSTRWVLKWLILQAAWEIPESVIHVKARFSSSWGYT